MSPYRNRPPCTTTTCFARNNCLTPGEWGTPSKYPGAVTSNRITAPGGQNHRVADGRSECEDNSRCRHLKASSIAQKGWPRASGETNRTTGYFPRLLVFKIGASIATQKRQGSAALPKKVLQFPCNQAPRKTLYFHSDRQQAASLLPALGAGGGTCCRLRVLEGHGVRRQCPLTNQKLNTNHYGRVSERFQVHHGQVAFCWRRHLNV